MKWTADGVHVGAVFGTPLVVQNSVFATAPGVFFLALWAGSTRDLIINLIVLPLIVLSIVAHELAHARAASACGVPVRLIALTWFGGFAEFRAPPSKRVHEMLIAFAGPATNLALAALAFLAIATLFPSTPTLNYLHAFAWRSGHLPHYDSAALEVFTRIGWFNLGLGLFNLLPGLPLDGGHILRAVLSGQMSRGRASWMAAWAGFFIGIVLVIVAFIIESGWTLLVGAFIAFSARSERKRLRYGD